MEWNFLQTYSEWLPYGGGGIVVIIVIIFLGRRKPAKKDSLEIKSLETEKSVQETINFEKRLVGGLTKSRKDIWQKIRSLVSGNKLDQEVKEQLEETLYQADIPSTIVEKILEQVNSEENKESIFLAIKKIMLNLFEPVQKTIEEKKPLLESCWKQEVTGNHSLQVIMIVGVNGVGKTTTVGKLAAGLSRSGKKVVIAAADTFRAAAKEQLMVWSARAKAELILGKDDKADPAAVCYQAVAKAIELKADFCLLDTAGRLHNNEQLMEELKKIKRVIKKLIPDAPQETLIVLDAMTGQNALKQAKQFQQALEGLTGVVLTKCDGSAKAGCALAIVEQLNVPIRFIGVGETLEDLDLFNSEQFVNALIDQ